MKIGIDLGTSFSSVAAEIDGKIEMIRIATGAGGFGDSFSIPTAAYVDNGRMLLGQAALNKRKLSPACFKSEFKRDLGTTTPFLLGEEEYLPEQLYTEFFLYFKNQAQEQTGEKIEKAYITHPANYGNNKKRLVEKAANNAGLLDVVLVDEPTAAAAGYSQKSRINEGDIVLVYDLGGGTFDVAIIKKTANGYVHLTEPLGISMCGGVDFDRAIFDDIIRRLGKSDQFDMDRIMKEKRFTAALSEVSIQIKHQLSQDDSHTEPIAVGGFDYFDYTLTRQEFEELIRPFVVSTCEKVKDILKNSGLVSTDIDRVLLVGGSSRVPLVRKMVQEALQKEIHMDADPELAVCQGAVSLGLMVKDDKQGRKDEQAQKVEENVNEDQKDAKLELKAAEEEKHNIQISDKQPEVEIIKPQRPAVIENPEYMKKIFHDVITGRNAYDGEWIYYTEKGKKGALLYKIKADGTQKTMLSDEYVDLGSYVKVEGEWIYYQNKYNKDKNGIFLKMRKDGTGFKIVSYELTRADFYDYVLKDGWIYFTDKNAHLKMMKTDGSGVTKLDKTGDFSINSISMEKDWIYYTSGARELCRVCIDGTKGTKIYKSDKTVGDAAVYDGWIYYIIFYSEKIAKKEIWKHELWKVRVDGTGNFKILDDFNPYFMSIFNGWMYYGSAGEDMVSVLTHGLVGQNMSSVLAGHMLKKYRRMRLDGTDRQDLSIEMLQQEIAGMIKHE